MSSPTRGFLDAAIEHIKIPDTCLAWKWRSDALVSHGRSSRRTSCSIQPQSMSTSHIHLHCRTYACGRTLLTSLYSMQIDDEIKMHVRGTGSYRSCSCSRKHQLGPNDWNAAWYGWQGGVCSQEARSHGAPGPHFLKVSQQVSVSIEEQGFVGDDTHPTVSRKRGSASSLGLYITSLSVVAFLCASPS